MAETRGDGQGEYEVSKNKEKCAADDTAPASRASSKGSKFSETFNKLADLLDGLKNDTAGASEFEKTAENQKALNRNLGVWDEEIKALNLSIENLQHSPDIPLGDLRKEASRTRRQAKYRRGPNVGRNSCTEVSESYVRRDQETQIRE